MAVVDPTHDPLSDASYLAGQYRAPLCAGRRELGYPCRLPESHRIHRAVKNPPPGPPSHWHPFVAPTPMNEEK